MFGSIFGSTHAVASNLNVCPSPPDLSALQPLSDDQVGASANLPLKRGHDSSISAGVIKMKADIDYLCAVSKLWTSSLRKWQVVFTCVGPAGIVGASVRRCVVNGEDPSGILRDVLGNKSPKTANKRASTMLALFDWLEKRRISLWPLTADTIMLYLNDDIKTKAEGTRGRTLLESLRFCKHVMGMTQLDDVIDNPIIAGRVKRLDALRGSVKQSRPLTLVEVRKLEDMLFSGMPIYDRYIVGCILFAIYSRSRWSDLSFLDTLELETTDTPYGLIGYVEGSTKHQKSGTTALKKALQMPLVSPIMGVTTRMWAVEWFGILRQVGFKFEAKPVGALCRAVSGTALGVRPVSSEEITSFLNSALECSADMRLTSHSMKTTTLVWCARYGIDEQSRTLLGHHELHSQSLACYSRDTFQAFSTI